MSSPFLGQIIPVAFNFPPKNWAFCNGQTLAINQNQALFALLGTTYGGNGQTTFQLPNLQRPRRGARRRRVDRDDVHARREGGPGGGAAHRRRDRRARTPGDPRPASKDEQTTNRPDGAYFTAGGAYGELRRHDDGRDRRRRAPAAARRIQTSSRRS